MKKSSDPSAELAELRKVSANKRCFDCQQAATTYAIPDLGVFICSVCGGLHREFGHRVKGLSTSNFTQTEVDNLKAGGNQKAATVWMALHNPKTNPIPNIKDTSRLKEFIRNKYIQKKFYKEEEKPQSSNWAEFKAPSPKETSVDLLGEQNGWNPFPDNSEPKKPDPVQIPASQVQKPVIDQLEFPPMSQVFESKPQQPQQPQQTQQFQSMPQQPQTTYPNNSLSPYGSPQYSPGLNSQQTFNYQSFSQSTPYLPSGVQNIYSQHYMMLSQVYQSAYGMPYPYNFQQWLSIVIPPPPQQALPQQPIQNDPFKDLEPKTNPFDLFR